MMPAAEATAESEAVAQVLNTSKRDEFMEVGIGRATAERLIKNRSYEPEAEILEKGVLSEETSEQVKEQFVEKDRDVA
jgi:hypothetical protein